jgi:uncharacterized protein YpuA (DUF1002 family)
MKKRSIIAVMLVVALCLITIVPAYAQENERIEAEQDRASVTLQCGLSHVSGSNYKLWGLLTSVDSDNLRIYVYLFEKNSSVVLASCMNSKTGTRVYASKSITLSSGTYTVKAYGYVGGSSYYSQRDITIP